MTSFKKTEKQNEAVKLLAADAKNIMLYGGSRSGKTFILVRSIFVRAAKIKSRHVILRKNFNHAKRSIWLETIPKVLSLCFPNLGAVPNKTDYFYLLPNGSEVWIGGLDDKDRTEKILGTEYSSIYFNECSQIDYQSIQIAKTRLAEKNDLKKKIYYDANPPTKSHWSYWLFEKKIDPLDEVPLTDVENYSSLLMNPVDNLENIDSEYLSMLEKMPEKEKNRFLLGLYTDESDGMVYYSFKRDQHVREVNRKEGTIFCGMDFNVDPMTAVLFQFIDKKFQVFDEIYLDGGSDTYRMAAELKKKGYAGIKILPDSTCRNRRTSGISDFKILEQAGFAIENTHNPFVTDRVNNINRLFTADRILIDPRCKKLINDLEKVSWKNNQLDQSGENKHLTHISDCLGYGCWKLEPILIQKEQRTIQL